MGTKTAVSVLFAVSLLAAAPAFADGPSGNEAYPIYCADSESQFHKAGGRSGFISDHFHVLWNGDEVDPGNVGVGLRVNVNSGGDGHFVIRAYKSVRGAPLVF
jgi:hypothetical protein